MTIVNAEQSELTPAQRRTLEELKRSAEPVVFPRDEIEHLAAEARRAINAMVARVGADRHMVASKNGISSALGCERLHVLGRSFEWSVRNARGCVAHRAIELLLNWRGEPTPADLVDEAIARLAEDDSWLGDWRRCALAGRRGRPARPSALESVTQFVECFPPLRHALAPGHRGPGPLAGRAGRSCCGPRPTSSSGGPPATRAARC